MLLTALDIRGLGIDRDSGRGIVMALPAATYALSHQVRKRKRSMG